jgi:hypothetical protein
MYSGLLLQMYIFSYNSYNKKVKNNVQTLNIILRRPVMSRPSLEINSGK